MPSKCRNYFLTCNPSAECYQAFGQMVGACGASYFAYILHDKDDTGNKHFHAVLSFDNARAFNSIINAFKGCHVEECRDLEKACKYLLHLTPASVSDGKHQYKPEEVHTNSLAILNRYLSAVDFEEFDPALIPEYLADGNCLTSYTFVRRFGVKNYNACWKVFNDCLRDFEAERDPALVEAVIAIRNSRGKGVYTGNVPPKFLTED